MRNNKNPRPDRRGSRKLHPHYQPKRLGRQPRININAVAVAALRNADSVVTNLLPGGRLCGHEYTVLNPRRSDHELGSFKINLETGKWADFASGDAGGDLVALVAYIRGFSQLEAAKDLMYRLGMFT